MSELRAGGPAATGAPQRPGIRALLGATALLLVAVPFALLLLLVQDAWRPLEQVDVGAADSLNRYAAQHSGFVESMRVLSALGSTTAYLLVLAVVVTWLLSRRQPRRTVFVVVTVAGSALLNVVVKMAVERARPVLPHPVAHATGMSFPSGHAQAAVVGYTVVLLVLLPVLHGPRRAAAAAATGLLVLGIGFSRVALGVHYVSDVLAGYVLGAAWLVAMTATVMSPGQGRCARADAGPQQHGRDDLRRGHHGDQSRDRP